jgi:hypothetical protein
VIHRFANAISTSAWQRSGAHQHTRFLPRSSCSAAMRAGCRTIHARYFAMTSSREPSRPITNGLLRSVVNCPLSTRSLYCQHYPSKDTLSVSFTPGAHVLCGRKTVGRRRTSICRVSWALQRSARSPSVPPRRRGATIGWRAEHVLEKTGILSSRLIEQSPRRLPKGGKASHPNSRARVVVCR